MKRKLKKLIRKTPLIYAWLRDAKYRLWKIPVLRNLVHLPPEIVSIQSLPPYLKQTVPNDKKRVLVFLPRSWSSHMVQDLSVAYSLRLRGAAVDVYTCGDRMPICQIAAHHTAPPMPCNFCKTYSDKMLSAFGFNATHWRDYVSEEEVKKIKQRIAKLEPSQFETYRDENQIEIGQYVRISTLWFMNSGSIDSDPEILKRYRQFLVSGSIVALAASRMLQEQTPDSIYMLSGIFFEEQIVFQLARRLNISVITHESGFHADSKVFARNGYASYYRYEWLWTYFKDQTLTNDENVRLDDYLESRKLGGKPTSSMYPTIQTDKDMIISSLSLDIKRPILVAFTNILWDSAVLGRNTIFEGMEEWLYQTIEYAKNNPHIQLLIRIHPAEIRLELKETRQKVFDVLHSRFDHLPANVKVIPPESPLSSYVLMELCDIGLVYTSTTGLEMALQGIPTIVSGETHYMNKGFTYEPSSIEEYHNLLAEAGSLSMPQDNSVELARRYANLFFFRVMIPFPLATSLDRGKVQVNFDDFSMLEPGKSIELDLICDGILHNKPIINGDIPEELLTAYAKSQRNYPDL